MPTRLQPRLHELIDKKRYDLERAITHHKEILTGVDEAMERNSDSLAWRLGDLDGSCSVIEKIYGELVFLSDVAGLNPPSRPF
jgi:hypothetical protein